MTPQTNHDDFVSLDDFSLPPAKPDRARSLALVALGVAAVAALLGLGGLLVGGLLNPTPTPLAVDVVALQGQVDEARATLTAFITATPPDLEGLQGSLEAQMNDVRVTLTAFATPDLAGLEARLSGLEATLQAMQPEATAESDSEDTAKSGGGFFPPNTPITNTDATVVAQAPIAEPVVTNEVTEEATLPSEVTEEALTEMPTETPTATPTSTFSNITAQVVFNPAFNAQIYSKGCGAGSPTYSVTRSATHSSEHRVIILGQDGDCWLIKWSELEGDAITAGQSNPVPAPEGTGFIRKGLVKLLPLEPTQVSTEEVTQEATDATATARAEQTEISATLTSVVPKVTLQPTPTATHTPPPTPTPSATPEPTATPIPVISPPASGQNSSGG